MASQRIAFIQARWHSELVDGCQEGFRRELSELRPDASIDVFDVPGALEIPLRAKLLADTGDYDAIVTDSCGSTYRASTHVILSCYPNCDGSSSPPILNAEDFQCFLNSFAGGCP